MAYGTNAPFGARPLNSIAGGSWTEKVNEYEIYASADGTTTYASSIFTGDFVQWGTSIAATAPANGAVGTIALYSPGFADGAGTSAFSTVPVLGIFMGCRYVAANAVSSTPTQVSPYWPASTQVKPGTKIQAYILDDPNVLLDIQVSTHINAAAAEFVAFPAFPNFNPTGGAPFIYTGSFGRNFGVNVGGGTNFTTVPNPTATGFYANNPATGSTITGQSGMYLDVDTSTVAYNNHDYAKNVTTLPLKPIFYTKNPLNVADSTGNITLTPFLNVTCIINNHVYGKGSTPPVYVA